MTYIIRPKSWRVAHPEDKQAEWSLYGYDRQTIDVYDRDETVDTGLLTADGNEIHRRVREPIGFVRFEPSE